MLNHIFYKNFKININRLNIGFYNQFNISRFKLKIRYNFKTLFYFAIEIFFKHNIHLEIHRLNCILYDLNENYKIQFVNPF